MAVECNSKSAVQDGPGKKIHVQNTQKHCAILHEHAQNAAMLKMCKHAQNRHLVKMRYAQMRKRYA